MVGNKIYKNNGDETFTKYTVGPGGNPEYGIFWGDYNNDGFLDILAIGSRYLKENNYIRKMDCTIIYKNNRKGSFRDSVLFKEYNSPIGWGDYNNDSFLDILIQFIVVSPNNTYSNAAIYKNNGNGSFSNLTGIPLIGVTGAGAWADYNNDGFLDILLAGKPSYSRNQPSIAPISKIYKNNCDETFSDQT